MMKCSSPLFQLKVLVSSKYIQEFHKDGNTFVEGRKGSAFSLEISNLTPRRILAHPTVDGLSVMTGKEASKNDCTHGYILNPHQSMLVPGWRLNDSEVAQFFFTGQGKSYAEKIGKGADKGVIAVAIWEEFVPTLNTQTTVHPNSSAANPHGFSTMDWMPAASPCGDIGSESLAYASFSNTGRISRGVRNQTCNAPQNLGTGFGNRVAHSVNMVFFVPATVEPIAVAVIYYNDIAGLRARGIKISEKKDTGLPNPFPKDNVGPSCAPPAGWNE